jgi:predicted nucleotidyltransferase
MTDNAKVNIDQGQLPSDVYLITQNLVALLQPDQIYLFGSTARGDAAVDSDYDFMIVVSDSDAPAHQRSYAAYKALREFTHAKDVLVWTKQEFESRRHLPASLPATILREGLLLYER